MGPRKRLTVVTILLVIILGGAFFYQTSGSRDSANKPENSLAGLLKKIEGENKTLTEDVQDTPPFSRDPFTQQKSNNGLPAETNENGDEKTNEAIEEKKEAISNYLIESAAIPFPNDSSQLKTALTLAGEGSPEELTKILIAYKQGLEQLNDLSPPEPLKDVHEKSIGVVEKSIGLLEETIHQTGGSVEETWNSEKRLEIVGEAQEIRAEILRMVEAYQIHLPPGVISY